MKGGGVIRDSRDAGPGDDAHTVRLELFLQERREFVDQWRQHVRGELHEGHVQPTFTQGLHRLEPNETGPNDESPGGAVVDLAHDSVHLGDRVELVDAGGVDALDRRHHRLGAGGEEQRVVGLGVRAVGAVNRDRPGGAIDLRDRGVHADVEIQGALQRLGGVEQERVAAPDLAGHVVRQPAVRERDVLAALEDDDLGGLVQAPRTRGRAHTAGDSADHNDFHFCTASR